MPYMLPWISCQQALGVLGNHEQDDDVGPFQLAAGPSRLRKSSLGHDSVMRIFLLIFVTTFQYVFFPNILHFIFFPAVVRGTSSP